MSAAGEKVANLATPLRKERIHNCGQLPVDSKLFNVRDANNNAVGCELEEHEADAVVSRCNGYDALLTQRDALEAREKVLRETAKALADRYAKFIDDHGGCDHDVGICWCEEIRAVDAVRAALATGAP